jgi:hypothetical protein
MSNDIELAHPSIPFFVPLLAGASVVGRINRLVDSHCNRENIAPARLEVETWAIVTGAADMKRISILDGT